MREWVCGVAAQVRYALHILHHVCRHPALVAAVGAAPAAVEVLSEQLQVFRDTADVFVAAAAILAAVTMSDKGDHAHALDWFPRVRNPASIHKRLEAIAAVLKRKVRRGAGGFQSVVGCTRLDASPGRDGVRLRTGASAAHAHGADAAAGSRGAAAAARGGEAGAGHPRPRPAGRAHRVLPEAHAILGFRVLQ